MKIVVLDGYALNPGDLSWSEFEKFGQVITYDRTTQDDQLILNRIGKAEIVLTNKTILNKNILEAAPKLRYVGVLATGYNVIDLKAAREKHIVVTNIPSYGTREVAQHTLALLLEITNQVGLHDRAIKAGEWTKAKDFTFWKKPLISLLDKTMGIIGLGHIGLRVAELAHALGMNVIFYQHHPQETSETWLEQVSLEKLYAQADVISLHVPQNNETTQMIDDAAITKMKQGVILLNTARGGLLDEEAVAAGLRSGKIGALGADVVSNEPIHENNPLLHVPNVYLTPHIAWAAIETRQRLMTIAVDNLASFLKNEPKNIVS